MWTAITSVSLRIKILGLLLSVAITSVGIYGYVGFITAKASLEKNSLDKLIAVRELKSNQIENYVEIIQNQVTTLSESLMIVGAMKDFSNAFSTLEKEIEYPPEEQAKVELRLKDYYTKEYFPRLAKNLDKAPDLMKYYPATKRTRILQDMYISNNKNPVGSKHLLNKIDNSSSYSKVHQKYHPVIKRYLEKFGYYDIFLVNPDNGEIIYSVYKEMDYATSLLTGPYKNSNIAKVFKQALDSKEKGSAQLIDFDHYEPSYNAEASFIASPIYDGDVRVGVLIFQMPIDKINDIMTSWKNWSEVGLGKSGESYIVADDYKLRNQSRFMIEDKKNYFKMLQSIGTDSSIIQKMFNLNSSIGLQEVKTKGTIDALKGNIGTGIFRDYRGIYVLSAYKPLNIPGVSWVLMSEIDRSEAFLDVYHFRDKILAWFFALILFIILISTYFTNSITRRIDALSKFVKILSKHDYNKEEDIGIPKDLKNMFKCQDEVGVLSTAFSNLGNDLKVSIDNLKLTNTLKERMEAELNVGRDIQLSMLPLLFPAFPDRAEFSVFSDLIPAREVGGDFYDFYAIDDKHFCICVGDVSGKGVPAALFMAVSKTLLKSNAANNLSPADILTITNNEISKNNPNYMFVTVFLAILDITTGELVYTSAGHNPPCIMRNGEAKYIDGTNNPVIGAMADINYSEKKIQLTRGDIVFLYTDGVTEAMNIENDLYSDERLLDTLSEIKNATVLSTVNKTYKSVETFAGKAEQADDITLLALQYFGKESTEVVDSFNIVITNEIKNIATVINEFNIFANKNNIADDVRRVISICFDDFLANIISYGYKDDGEYELSADLTLTTDRAIITLADSGIPFNPFIHETPNTSVPLEEREIGGLGIHIVRNMVEKVNYKRKAGKNITTLIKYIDI